MSREKTTNQAPLLFTMFLALELILSFAPAVGAINLGGHLPAITVHLPVLLAAVLLGPGAGAFMGLVMGVCRVVSLAFLAPDPILSTLFTPFVYNPDMQQSMLSLVIALVPPTAMGALAGVAARRLGRALRGRAVVLGLAGLLGAVVGGLLTWLGVFLVFGSSLSNVLGVPFSAIFLDCLRLNLAAEAAAAALVCGGLGTLIYKKFISED